MAYKNIRVSDLSGQILDDDKVVTVVVRSHPDLAEGKVFDAAPDELKDLKGLQNLVAVEYKLPNGTTQEHIFTKDEFSKVVSADVLDKADGIRGRRSGYRPNGG